MVKVNAALFQECCDCCEIRLLCIDVVLAGVILESFSRDDQGGIGKEFVLSIRLRTVSRYLIREWIRTYKVHDFLEMYFHLTVI